MSAMLRRPPSPVLLEESTFFSPLSERTGGLEVLFVPLTSYGGLCFLPMKSFALRFFFPSLFEDVC